MHLHCDRWNVLLAPEKYLDLDLYPDLALHSPSADGRPDVYIGRRALLDLDPDGNLCEKYKSTI